MRITIEIDETRLSAMPTATVEPTGAPPDLTAPLTGPASGEVLSAGASVENPGDGGTTAEGSAMGADATDTSAGAAPGFG
jgi:hypothetical protein